MEDLATGLADERVVEILFLDQGGRLVGDVVTGWEDRRRCWSPKGNQREMQEK